mgnify:CR=1 FL=1
MITHLKPLADSEKVVSVTMVSTTDVPQIDKVIAVYPPDRLVRFTGKVPARLIYFSWLIFASIFKKIIAICLIYYIIISNLNLSFEKYSYYVSIFEIQMILFLNLLEHVKT